MATENDKVWIVEWYDHEVKTWFLDDLFDGKETALDHKEDRVLAGQKIGGKPVRYRVARFDRFKKGA